MTRIIGKLRYAVIGVSGVGQHHCRFANGHDDVDVVALVDPNSSAIEHAINANAFKPETVSCYSSHIDMINNLAACQIDAVSICTPHAFLYDIARDCLAQGLHVFIEKPFAIRLSQADHLVSLAQEKKCSLAVAYQYRTFATPQRLKNAINSGVLGDISRVLWTWFEFRPQSYYSRDDWRATWDKSGGGLLMNQISHELDLIRWLFGEPIDVSAVLSNQFGRCELEDIASISMTFDNGLVVTLQASLNEPHGHAVKQVVGDQGALFINGSGRSAANPNDEIEFYCYSSLKASSDSLDGDHAQPNSYRASNAQRRIAGLPVQRSLLKKARRVVAAAPGVKKLADFFRQTDTLERRPVSGHGKLMDDFVSSVINQHAPLISGKDAAKTLQLINAIIMSAVEKRRIRLPLNPVEYDMVFNRLTSGESTIVKGCDER